MILQIALVTAIVLVVVTAANALWHLGEWPFAACSRSSPSRSC